MKKMYYKPEILFENFVMSTNIAGDCGTLINNASYETCAYITRSGHHVFTSNYGVCTTTEDDGDYNGICYHVPVEAEALFNS